MYPRKLHGAAHFRNHILNASGVASFPALNVNKAGGYLLTVDGSYDGITGKQALSNLFNIKNQ